MSGRDNDAAMLTGHGRPASHLAARDRTHRCWRRGPPRTRRGLLMTSENREGSDSSTYAMGYSEEFLRMLARRNAEGVAFHLLPHLRPGMKLLDFGCGPGTISVGLAKAVAPGELHGIDLEATQIDMARAAADAGGHGNASFRTGDVTRLPFEDETFDVAHCHAVLMHVPDLDAALAEVKRVLKPGGIIAARELVTSSNFYEPDPDGHLAQATEVFRKLLAANGGHPELGRELKSVLVNAGFADVRATASFEPFSEDDDRTFFRGFVRGWFLSPSMKHPAIELGLATERDFDAGAEELDRWHANPGAFAAFAWGEAVARKL